MMLTSARDVCPHSHTSAPVPYEAGQRRRPRERIKRRTVVDRMIAGGRKKTIVNQHHRVTERYNGICE